MGPKIGDEDLARAAGKDAANRQMKAAGRTAWSKDDYNLATSTYNRLMGPKKG